MPATVFYSWQSDLPNTTNRNFLEDVIKKAINSVGNPEFVEAERPEYEHPQSARSGIVLDKDTKGVPGTPPIAETIFEKIANCAVFVPDLTFVGRTEAGRLLPNPNVLIEYGWARAKLGHARIVPVMNTAYGDAADGALPFDMRHLRRPIAYSLAEQATPEEKAEVKKNLTTEVAKAIRLILEQQPPAGTNSAAPHQPTPYTADPSTFLELGEKLRPVDVTPDTNWVLLGNQHMYLRVFPTVETSKMATAKEAKDLLQQCPVLPLARHNSSILSRTERGAVVFAGDPNGNKVSGLTQLFLNNELWGIDCQTLDKNHIMQWKNEFGYSGDYGFIPSALVEEIYRKTLASYLALCRNHRPLNPPLKWRAGMTGVKGYKMGMTKEEHPLWQPVAGEVVRENISFEGEIDDLDINPAKILLPFFEHVWRECGLDYPASRKQHLVSG